MEHINSYEKGMNKDLSSNSYTNKNYLDAHNLRILSKEGSASGPLTNHIKGTNYKIALPSSPSAHQVIGTIDITSKETVLLCALQNGNSALYLFTHDGTDNLQTYPSANYKLLYTDATSSAKLGFAPQYPIRGVSRIETENIRKIYWIDGFHELRYMNIENDYTTSPPEATEFSQIPLFGMTEVIFAGYTSGTMQAGKYSYVYQLYKTNGAETVFTSTSEIISVASDIGFGDTEKSIRGSEKDTVTNRGVKLSISGLDTSFTRIRVLAIQYEDLFISPLIRIITEQEYSGSSVDVIDYGQSFGTYGLDEIQLIYSDLIAQTIEVKNNILFLGNLDESIGDVQAGIDAWDAWAKSYTINSTTERYNDGDVNTNFDDWKYQKNSANFGATGPNVDWDFITEEKQIQTHNLSSYDSTRQLNYIANSNAAAFGKKLAYQRGEVYRFGIQFFDNKGRKLFTKWSCDLRIPGSTEGFNLTSINGTIISALYIYPRANVKTLPDVGGVPLKWKMVYVKRSTENKSILASGIFDFVNNDGGIKDFGHTIPTLDDYITNYVGREDPPGTPAGTQRFYVQYLNFISPEISFGSEEYKLVEQIDFTDITGITSVARKNFGSSGTVETSTAVVDNATWGLIVAPYGPTSWVSGSPSDILYKVLATPEEKANSVYSMEGDPVNHYVENHAGNNNQGMMGTSLMIKAARITDLTYFGNIGAIYGHLIRDLSGVQYGGNSESARSANVYISCGALTQGIGISTCYYGDTFIQMFDYLRSMREIDSTEAGFTHVIYFPCETQVNLTFRNDDCYHRLTIYDEDTVIRNMHEDGWVNLDIGITLSKLYTYNNTYSRLNDLYKYFPKPFDFQDNDLFETRARRSDIKINGETTDSWLKFRTNNFIDIDSRYGPLVRMKTFKNRLYFWQEGAFGIFPVGEKEAVSASGGEALNIGSTGILDRYDYTSEQEGITEHDAMTVSKDAIYFYDQRFKRMNQFTGQSSPVSFIYGMDSWFDQYLHYTGGLNTTCRMVYDSLYNEIIIVFTQGLNIYTVIINGYLNCFSSFISLPATKIYEMQNTIFSTDENPVRMHQHNRGSYCSFYANIRDSEVTLLINPQPNQNTTSTYDFFDILTNVFDASDNDLYETFDSIQINNDYQDSGTILLEPDDNIVRKFRNWRFNTIRDGDPDESHIVNPWIKVSLVYENDGVKRLSMYNFITNYRPYKLMN